MNIEDRVWSRIEAILINDARNSAELQRVAPSDEPPISSSLERERNLFHRIVTNYRSAVREVNSLLELNIGFLSAFLRIVETIKHKEDFQEICLQIVDCVLDDLDAEYCGMIFLDNSNQVQNCVEGVREDAKFLQVHTDARILGSRELEDAIENLAKESNEPFYIEDVYSEPRFHNVDFPSVVRSLICLPVILHDSLTGILILSHSMPRFFTENHLRVLKVLASTIAHLKLLTARYSLAVPAATPHLRAEDNSREEDLFSLVVLDCTKTDTFEKAVSLNRNELRGIRSWISQGLEGKESVLFHGKRQLLILLPGTSEERLPARIRTLRHSLEQWKKAQSGSLLSSCIHLGFSTCRDGEDLVGALQAAAFMMHPEDEEQYDSPTVTS